MIVVDIIYITMSMFRDISYIKNMAVLSETRDVSEDACRLILADMELKLRQVVKDSVKFMKHFNRSTICDVDVNCALENAKMGGKMVGMRGPYVNEYEYSEENKWILDNRTLVIGDEMKDVEHEHFMNRYPVEISLDWVSSKGSLLNTQANKDTICLFESKKSQKNPIFELKTKIDSNLIKEPQTNILSKEADKFLNSFFRILKENLEGAEASGASNKNFEHFVQGRMIFILVLSVMERNPSLQILVPFIVNRIEKNYDVPESKGYLKKNMYLMVINSLNNNRSVNLEYHVESIMTSRNTCSSGSSCFS